MGKGVKSMRCLIVDMVKSKIYAKSPCLCVCVCVCVVLSGRNYNATIRFYPKLCIPFTISFPPQFYYVLFPSFIADFCVKWKYNFLNLPFSLSLSFLYFLSLFLDALLSLVSCMLVASYKLICPTLYCLVNYLHSVVQHV